MIDTQDHLGPCCDGTGGKPSEPRKQIDHFHLFVLLLRSPTQVALKCVSHQVPTTAHLSRGTLTCAHSGSASTDNTCEGTGGASVGGGTANGSSRCLSTPLGGAVGVQAWCGVGRESRQKRCMPHTWMTKLASAFACFGRGGKISERGCKIGTLVATITTLRQFHLPRAVLGVFSCHGHHAHYGHP